MNLDEQYMYDEKQEMSLLEKREYLVVKSNQLVQKSRYELSLQEQKVMAFICSKIKPVEFSTREHRKVFQLEYEFDIREYCQVCGLDYENGKNYINIKSVLNGLRDKSIWITMPDGSESLCGWLSKVTANRNSGKVKIRLDEDLVPYLFDLKKKFMQYRLIHILGMKSAFSIRLYELLKSYSNMKRAEFDIDELKRLLMVDGIKSYFDFSLFRKKVLEIALFEINEYTDIDVSYHPIKSGRKVIKVVFHIIEKNNENRSYSLNRAFLAVDKVAKDEYEKISL